MRVQGLRRVVAGVAVMCGVLLGGVSGTASAAPGPSAPGVSVEVDVSECGAVGSLCVWEGAFTGRWVLYEGLNGGCVNVPFGVLADMNMTDRRVEFFRGADCSGTPVHSEPSLGFHSWVSKGALYSFRAV